MIKLKDILKESYVWERKFGEPLPTLADVQRKKKLSEGKWKVKGMNLQMPGGEESSMPGTDDRDRIVVQIKRDKWYLNYSRTEYIARGPYQKEFKNKQKMVAWLNKEKAKYIGIENIR